MGAMNRFLPLLVALAACSEPPPPETPAKDPPPGPAEVATAFLRAYAKRDLAAMKELSLADNGEVFDELERDGEKSARYRSIFSGWRWETARDWNGTVGPVRYRRRTAYVKVKELEELHIIVVAKLEREQGAWRFEDLAQVARSHFEKRLAEEPGDAVR